MWSGQAMRCKETVRPGPSGAFRYAPSTWLADRARHEAKLRAPPPRFARGDNFPGDSMKRASLATALGVVSLLAMPSRAASQQSATADSIRAGAQRFIAALASRDIDQFVALFASEPDFIYVDGGRIYPDRAALKSAGSGFFKGIKTFNASWDPTKVLVLSPDAGVFTGVMKVQAENMSGNAIWPNGKIWTLAYQRRGGKWMIVQAHEATVPAPKAQ
jgi:uncharacterized protein (TIGR02246 family)